MNKFKRKYITDLRKNFSVASCAMVLRRFSNSSSSGLTLVELLMVVSVLSILLALGFSGFSDSIKAQSAISGTEQVGYAIKKAKYFSRTKGVKTYFNFPIGSDNFNIHTDNHVLTNQNNFDAMSGTFTGKVNIIGNTCPDLCFNVDGSLMDSSGAVVYSDCAITIGYSGGPQETLIIRGKPVMLKFSKLNFNKCSRKTGLSITEMVIATALFATVMLSVASFSTNFLTASATSSKQIENVEQSRKIFASISNEIANAAYIYPAETIISLSATNSVTGTSSSFNINTSKTPAMLFCQDMYNDGTCTYGFVAYFLKEGTNGKSSLYQFTEKPSYDWVYDTSPAIELTNFTGTVSKLVSDINTTNSNLTYIMNYSNGITDKILQGQIGGSNSNNSNALIKGIDWKISQVNIETQTIRVKGLSRNVPRFIE